MRFQKGNKFSKGGTKDNKGGRPTNQQKEIKKAAREIAREYIEKNVQPILETYLGLAAGKVVKRIAEDGAKSFELSVDPPTTRHAIDKLLPDEQMESPQQIKIEFLQFADVGPQPKTLSLDLKQPLPQENRLPEPQGQDGIISRFHKEAAMKGKGPKHERETIINFNEEE